MDDDFGTPQAVAVLFDLVREINRGSERGMDITAARGVLKELTDVIGFNLQERKRLPVAVEPFIEALIAVRNDLRNAKQWQLADMVRDRLNELGITVEDTAKGTNWKLSR